jgi:hypothetical protein
MFSTLPREKEILLIPKDFKYDKFKIKDYKVDEFYNPLFGGYDEKLLIEVEPLEEQTI